MNTVIIEHADNSTTELLQQLAKVLGLSVTTKVEEETAGVITNPVVMEAIEMYESGKVKAVPLDQTEFETKAKNA
jgi:hypothetical protein